MVVYWHYQKSSNLYLFQTPIVCMENPGEASKHLIQHPRDDVKYTLIKNRTLQPSSLITFPLCEYPHCLTIILHNKQYNTKITDLIINWCLMKSSLDNLQTSISLRFSLLLLWNPVMSRIVSWGNVISSFPVLLEKAEIPLSPFSNV